MTKPDAPGPPPLDQFPELKVLPYHEFSAGIYNKRRRSTEARKVVEEELPDHDYWKKVDQVKNSVKNFKDLALKALRRPRVGTENLNLLEDTIKKSGTIPSLGSLLAVVIGEQGFGINTLVDRLVQVPERTSCTGWPSSASTDVPITLKCSQDEVNAASSFITRIYLLGPKDIQDICEHHVKSIAAYQAKNDGDTRRKKEKARKWAEQLRLAHDLGKRKLKFEATLNNLVGSKAGTDDVHVFTQTCAAWALKRVTTITKDRDILNESTPSSPVIQLQAVSLKDLQECLETFFKGRHVTRHDKVLIKSIEISLEANILSTGLKLVDIPGFDNDDPFKSQNTRENICKSHIRLVCTNFNRPQVHHHITESIREVGLENTYIIVMCLDSSMTQDDANEAIHRDPSYPFPQIKSHINRTRDMIKGLTRGDQSEQGTDTTSSDGYTQLELTRSDDSTQLELIRLSAYVSYLRREARLAYAKKRCSEYQEELWVKYYDPKARDSVRIHFISDEEYAFSDELCYDPDGPFLDPRESGIFRLRQALLRQTGDRSLQALQHHVETSMISCHQLCARFCRGREYPDPQNDALRTELSKRLPEMRNIINELGTYLGIAEVLVPDDSIHTPKIGEWDDSWLAWACAEKGH